MKRCVYILSVLVLFGCGFVPAACGGVVLASNTWDSTIEGWNADELYVNVDHDAGYDGFLETTFASGRSVGETESIVYQDATAFFAGGWTNTMWIEFDFFAQDETPDFLDLQFRGVGENASWGYHLTPSSTVGDWTTYSVALDHAGWYYGDGTSSESESVFLDDLGTIDWVGVYIYDGSVNDAHSYGLDNFQLMVPEPAEYALAFSALAVTWLSVRKRRKKGVETSDAAG
jgi:hypothetical protein